MMVERTEFLGDRDGRQYKVNLDDEIKVIEKNGFADMDGYEKERYMAKEFDSFEDGYNVLEEVDGILYEVMDTYRAKFMRRAYL